VGIPLSFEIIIERFVSLQNHWRSNRGKY